MHRRIRLPAAPVFATLVCLALAISPARALDAAGLQARLERLRQDAHAPGATAAVMVKGELVYSGGVGLADDENAVPMRGDSVHNIGSVSKVVAVIALMQLVERGKVDLDAEIQAYAPWFPRKQAPITVRQILTHTSGIRHYRDGEFGEGEVLRFRQFDDIQAASRRWQDDPLLFAPGTHWSYSSFATNLLQAAIEKASGQGMEAYMREHVWRPAGMEATQFDVPARIVPRRAHGYDWDADSGTLANAVQENVSYKYVGGGILSTDVDMVRMAHALNAGRLLGRKAIAEMYRPQLDPSIALPPPLPGEVPERDGVPVQGLIWRVLRDAGGRSYMGHSGSVKGTLSYLANYPEQDVAVALHVNAQGAKPKPDLRAAAEALAAEVLPAAGSDGRSAGP